MSANSRQKRLKTKLHTTVVAGDRLQARLHTQEIYGD